MQWHILLGKKIEEVFCIPLIKKISDAIAYKLSAFAPGNHKVRALEISYALQAIIGEGVKILILIALFMITGQLPLFFFSFIILITLRMFAGGYHAESFTKCFITTLLFFILAVGLGDYFSPYILMVKPYLLFISLIIVGIYAPVPSNQRPIKNPKRYARLKGLAIFVCLAWTLTLLLLDWHDHLISVGVLTILLESLQLTFKKGEAP